MEEKLAAKEDLKELRSELQLLKSDLMICMGTMLAASIARLGLAPLVTLFALSKIPAASQSSAWP